MLFCCFFFKKIFFDNSKKYKTKTIPKNSILFKPKYHFKRTSMLLFGIVSVFYCCFVQCIRLESGPIRNLFKFPCLTFWFQFSYCFFIFHCIIFWLLSTTVVLFQIVVTFSRQNMPFGRQKKGFACILSKYSIEINLFRTNGCLENKLS